MPNTIPEETLQTRAQDIDRQLNAIRYRLRRVIAKEYEKGRLTGPQRAVMQALVKGKATTMKELVKTIGLSQSTMSGIVDRLVERGLVLRKKNPKDKRAVVLAPSKEVQTFIRDRMQHLVLSPLLEALGKGSESDHAKIFEGLKTLENLLSRAGQ